MGLRPHDTIDDHTGTRGSLFYTHHSFLSLRHLAVLHREAAIRLHRRRGCRIQRGPQARLFRR